METPEEKLLTLFKELGLPIEKSDFLSDNDSCCYKILNGEAYIGFDKNGKVKEFHGAYE